MDGKNHYANMPLIYIFLYVRAFLSYKIGSYENLVNGPTTIDLPKSLYLYFYWKGIFRRKYSNNRFSLCLKVFHLSDIRPDDFY